MKKDRPISRYDHSSETGSWRFLFREPPPPLRPFIMGISGFEGVVRPNGGHGLGSPSAELVIGLGGWAELRAPDSQDREVFRTDVPFVSGLRERSKAWRLETGFSGLQVDLTVLGAWRVIGVPLSLVANCEVEAAEFLGRSVERLQQRLSAETEWPTRFEILESFLGSRIESSRPGNPAIRQAWDLVVRSRGRMRVEELRRKLGIGHRAMLSRFKEEVGLTPKRSAELVRFDHALTLATGKEEIPWIDLAYRAGYYDQAHLINDFRHRLGMTPAELRRKLVPEARMSGQDQLGALFGKK